MFDVVWCIKYRDDCFAESYNHAPEKNNMFEIFELRSKEEIVMQTLKTFCCHRVMKDEIT